MKNSPDFPPLAEEIPQDVSFPGSSMKARLPKRVPLLLLFVLLGSCVIVFVVIGNGVQAETLTVDLDGEADYTTIQEAIDAAVENDTVFVRPGTYHENITVMKKIILQGHSPESTVINGTYAGDAITLDAEEIVFRGFKVTGSGPKGVDTGVRVTGKKSLLANLWITGNENGVKITGANGCRVENCSIVNNSKTGLGVNYGDVARGDNQFIYNNSITGNSRGMHIMTRYNTLDRNDCSYNSKIGILLEGSDNTIKRNICNNVGDIGLHIWGGGNNDIVGNEFSYSSHTGVRFENGCNENIFRDCTINYNVVYGIYFDEAYANEVRNSTLRGNGIGFLLYTNSRGNILKFSNILGNEDWGAHVLLSSSSLKALDNWWGDASGPYHPDENPEGKGDNISNHMDFDPWTTQVVNQKPRAIIASLSSKVITEGGLLGLRAAAEDDGYISRYVWQSSLDGEFYNGSDTFILNSNLSCGEHLLTLLVQDGHGNWSSEVNTTLTILPRCDYDPGLNPSSLSLSTGEQCYPEVSGNLISWQDDRCDGWDIFMFSLTNPDEVQQVSLSSATLGGQFEIHMQTSPMVEDEKIVWFYEWWDFGQHKYYFYGYDTSRPELGRLALLELESSPVKSGISGDWLVWTEYDTSAGIFTPFALRAYDTGSYETLEIANIATFFGLDEGKVAYFCDPGTITVGSETAWLNIYQLETGTRETQLEVPGQALKVAEVAFSGDIVTWEDHRDDDSGLYEDGNSDIYFLNLENETMAQITVDGGTQEDPDTDGETIVWVDKRSGTAQVYAYSISRNRIAVLSDSGSSCEDPRVSGDLVVWTQEGEKGNSLVYLYNLSLADWQEGEAVFTKLVPGQGGEPGTGGSKAERPVWQEGDFWTWSGEGLDEEGLQISAVFTETVVKAGVSRTVWGQVKDCYETKLEIHWLGNDTKEEYTAWYTQEGFMPEGEDWQGLTTFLWLLDFPFELGDTWGDWNELECTGRENITIEGKVYDCFVVVYEETMTLWYCPELKHFARMEGDEVSYEISSSSQQDDEEEETTGFYNVSNTFFLLPLLLFGVGLAAFAAVMTRTEKRNRLMIAGLLLVVVGLVLALSFIPLLTGDGEDFDSWIQDSPKEGDTIWISGYLESEEENSFAGTSVFLYRLEGSQESFLSSEDLGGEGSFVVVQLEIRELGPEARRPLSPWLVLSPGLVLIISGTVMVVVGGRRAGVGGPGGQKKKEKEVGSGSGYPDPATLSQQDASGFPDQQFQQPLQQQGYLQQTPQASYPQPPQQQGHQQQTTQYPLTPQAGSQQSYPQQGPQQGQYRAFPIQQGQQVQQAAISCPQCSAVISRDRIMVTPEGKRWYQCLGCGTSRWL